MKPFIIFKELKDNKVELTEEELEELITKAYDQGNSDGYTKGWQEANSFHYQLDTNFGKPPVKDAKDTSFGPYYGGTMPFVYQTPVTCSTSDDTSCKNIKAEASPILGCL